MVLPVNFHRYSTRPIIDKKDPSRSGSSHGGQLMGSSIECRAYPSHPRARKSARRPTSPLGSEVSCVRLPMFWCASIPTLAGQLTAHFRPSRMNRM